MSEWISVADLLPDDYKTVLVTDKNTIFPAFFNIKTKCWLAWSGWKHMDLKLYEPIYWMPLPELPK